MRATIRQVAELAGVSRTTVSNVMLGRDSIVTPEKRRLVMDAVRELDYVPVRPILQNRHFETRVIAVPADQPYKMRWGINSQTYMGICEAAMIHGYDVTMLLRKDPDWALDRSAAPFLDRRSDGIISASPVIGEASETFEALARHGIPTVVCYRRDVPAEAAWVDPDNTAAMQGAVAHLVSRGHSKIGHLTQYSDAFDKTARVQSFLSAVNEFGLPMEAEWIREVPYFTANAELARHFIRSGVTAVVCMNDLLAIDLMCAMRKVGMAVPGDISLVGMDGPEAERHGLTPMEFSFVDIGRAAVESLVALLQGKPADQCRRIIPVRLVERQSVQDIRAPVS